jgi:putative membrane protein
MDAFLTSAYPWVKSLHVISIIAWMAGLLYLPRLFVYHSTAAVGSDSSETFKVMERRLLRAIMNPAMVAAYLFGIALLLTPGIVSWSSGWIHLKLLMVAGLTWVHHSMGLWRKAFERDERPRSARFFRMINEVPTLMMIVIVFMVVAKPF